MKDSKLSEPRRFSLFPKPLSATVTEVVKPVFKKHGFAEHRILTQWNQIVGEEFAAVSVPQKLAIPRGKKEGGTLHVLAAPGRALELQHLQPVILDKIATYFGYPAVARLAFTQTSPAFFRKEKKSLPAPASAATADDTFVALAAGCEDEDVRRALKSLGQALAAVEK